ncbi:hypothetical protein Tco_1213977 [Tanacetum coccineum]
MVRAKELFTWNPTFLEYKEREYSSDVESAHASINNELNRPPNGEEPDDEFMSDEDGVPETIFGSSSLVPNHRDEDKDAAHSDDPFGLYDLLKNKKGTTNHVPSPSLSHPPGFTPVTSENRVENLTETGAPKVFNAQVMNSSQDIPVDSNKTFSGQNVVKSGGSVLDVMEDIIRVGQVMGYSMEGCVKDFERRPPYAKAEVAHVVERPKVAHVVERPKGAHVVERSEIGNGKKKGRTVMIQVAVYDWKIQGTVQSHPSEMEKEARILLDAVVGYDWMVESIVAKPPGRGIGSGTALEAQRSHGSSRHCSNTKYRRHWLSLELIDCGGSVVAYGKQGQQEFSTILNSRSRLFFMQDELSNTPAFARLKRGCNVDDFQWPGVQFSHQVNAMCLMFKGDCGEWMDVVVSASQKAIESLPNVSKAISELTTFKGVGPATASAVLAAYALNVAPFMSDEARENPSRDFTKCVDSLLTVHGFSPIKFMDGLSLSHTQQLKH